MEVKKSKNISLMTMVIIAICSFLCPLARAEDVSDYISYIYIYQILDYGDPTDSEDLMYEFNLELNAYFDMAGNMDADVDSVEILTPAGYTFQIPKQPGQWSDNIWTSYEYIEEEVLPGFWIRDASWKYRARFSNLTDLQAYGDGDYTITLHFNNGSQSQTTAWFGVADTTDPVQQPTQEPIIIFPQPNQVVESPVTFSWESCTDLNASGIWIALEEKTSGDYGEEGFDVDETSWGPIYLANGEWEIALDFENWSYLFGNDDGIGVFSAKYSRSRYEFTVATPQTNNYEVWGGDTFIHDDYGTIDEDFFLKGYWSVDELISNGYEKLGESDGQTATFSGQYEYYVIATRGQILLDSIQGSDGSYYSSFENSRSSGNITDPNYMLGPPDELYATIGMDTCASYFCGYFAFTNPGDWTGLTVITNDDNINISKSVVNEGPIGSGDIITYRISFDTLDLTDEVTDVFIEDYLPDEVNYISDNAILGFYDENEHKYIWISSSLAPGSTRELLLTVQINPDVPVGTEITNYATIDCDEKPATTASVTITVNKEPPIEIEDIQITSGTIIRDDISGDVTISMNLPEGIGQDDVDTEEPIMLNLGGIQIAADDSTIEEIDGRVRITAIFDTAAVLDALAGNGQFDVEIIGKLKDGRTFSGQTTITIAETEAVVLSDYISYIDIAHVRDYGDPTDSEDLMYEFNLKIFADDDKAYNMNSDVSRIEVLTPNGYTFKIQKLPGKWSDNIWTSYGYEEQEVLPDIWSRCATWEYRVQFSDIADLQDYGDGEYTVTLHYNNGNLSKTTAWFGMADGQTPVLQPPEPMITYPLPNQIVESPVTFSWESFADTNQSSIWMDIEDGYIEGEFDVNETSYGPVYLTNGRWEIKLDYRNTSMISSNDDGIVIDSFKYSRSRYDFKVINYLTNTYEVWGGDVWIDPLEGSYGSIDDINENKYEQLFVDPNNPGTFWGEYNYYVIATKGQFLLDSVQGSDGSYYYKFGNNTLKENIINEDYLLGETDGLCATIGDNIPSDDYSGWLVLENPDGWQGLTVTTRKLNISKDAVNTPEELENISPGDTITYMISFDTSEMLYDVNSVIVVDYLPDEVGNVLADTNEVYGFYDASEHTFIWLCPILSPDSVIKLHLTVEVNRGVAPDTIITNFVIIDSNETPATVASTAVTVSKDQQRETEMQIIPDTICRNGVDVSGVMVILEMPSDITEEKIDMGELLVLSLDSEDSDVTVNANADQNVIEYEGVIYVIAVFDKTRLLNAIPGYGKKQIKVEGKLIEGSFIGRGILMIN